MKRIAGREGGGSDNNQASPWEMGMEVAHIREGRSDTISGSTVKRSIVRACGAQVVTSVVPVERQWEDVAACLTTDATESDDAMSAD